MASNPRRMEVHAMGADMTENWKEWEGRTVDGKFVLEGYLGGSNGSATFRTRMEEDPAAIKVILLNEDEGEKQLRQWKAAKMLNHPNLLRVMAAGSEVAEGGQRLVYIVEELADENLAQILPERALNGEETRGMLRSVLGGLGYIYDKALVHGGIRPTNVLAVGEQVKLSSDSVRAAGDVPRSASVYDAPELGASGVTKAGDEWALGMTMVEVLTQHVPAWDPARMGAPEISPDVMEPFRTIARRCLEIDPSKRCGLREIRDRLEMGAGYDKVSLRKRETVPEAVPAETGSRKWLYWAAAVVVLGILGFLFLRPRPKGAPRGESSTEQIQQAPPPASSAPAATSTPNEGAVSPPTSTASKPASEPPTGRSTGVASQGEILERVMPQVAASARRTITGTVKVRVKVSVDANGNVVGASLTNPGPSKYFARLALEAAQKWRFAPTTDHPDVPRVWNLVFGFTRSKTEASAARAR